VTLFAEHPEELVDRALRGDITPDETRRLKEHVASCTACASHLMVGPEWARAIDPVDDDNARDRNAAAEVMAKLRRPAPARRIRYVWGLAAAALLFAGAAGAQYARHIGLLRSHLWATAPLSEPSTETAEVRTKHGSPSPAAVSENTPSIAEGAEATPSIDTPSPVAAPAAIAPTPTETSGQLFSEANDLRRGGKGAQSIAVYRKLQKLFPGSPEAEISYATLGSLLLEQTRAQEALAQFDHYIDRGGPLLEDVLAGKASALGRLGRSREERKTWESLLSRFPSSVYAGRAKVRLAELPQ